MYLFSLAEKASTIINIKCLHFSHTKSKKSRSPTLAASAADPCVKHKQTKALECMWRMRAFYRSQGLPSHPCKPTTVWELKGSGQSLGPYFYPETQNSRMVRWKEVQNTMGAMLLPKIEHEHGWAPRRGLESRDSGLSHTFCTNALACCILVGGVNLASPNFLEERETS